MVSAGEDDFGALGFKNRQTRIPGQSTLAASGTWEIWKMVEPSLGSFQTRRDPWHRTDPPSAREATLYNGCIMTVRSSTSSFLSFFLSHSGSLLVPSYFFVIISVTPENVSCPVGNPYRYDSPHSDWKHKKDLKVGVNSPAPPPPNEPKQASNHHSTYRKEILS